MKRGLAIVFASAMLFGSAAVASAHHQDGHEANYHGMCTAFFSGSEQGRQQKQANGAAFQAFKATVGDYDGDGDEDNDDVKEFCTDMTGGYGNPGDGQGSGEGDGTGDGNNGNNG